MLNLTSLNQRINYLLTEINKKVENPMTSDLDANGFDILNVNNIDLNTINGGAYPPAVDNLDATLTAGNNAGTNDIDMNNNDIINIKELELNGTSTITDATGDLVVQPPLNQTLQLGNNIYIDTNTNRVGINVPVPTEDLEIDGNIQMDTGSTSKIVFYDIPNAHEHGEIDATGDGVNGGIVKIQTKVDGGGVTEKFRINNTGAIGLGGATYGNSGEVLTSQGSTALPIWSPPPLSWDVITPSSVTNGTINADGSFDITQGIVHDIFPTTYNVFRVYATCSNRHFLNMVPYRLNGTTSNIWAGGIRYVYGGGFGGNQGFVSTVENSSSVQVNYNDYFLDQGTPLPCTLIMDVMVDRTNNNWQATTDVRTTNDRFGMLWTAQATGHITGRITNANEWRSFEFTTVTLSNGTTNTGNVHGKVFGRQV